jgi:hypothetical protein
MIKNMKELISGGAFRVLGASLLLLSIVFVLSAEPGRAEQKFHPLKNYSVEYKLEGITVGTKNHYSQKWGNLVCWVEVSETTMPGGSAVKRNEKIITYVKDGEQWIVTINLDDNTGTKMKNPMFATIAAGMKSKSPEEFSEEFMTRMGGKVVGEKVVNGEKCKEWTLMGGANTCITPDQISVETSANMAGITMKETAVKVKRNDSGPSGICDIGDSKLKEMDLSNMMQQQQQ